MRAAGLEGLSKPRGKIAPWLGQWPRPVRGDANHAFEATDRGADMVHGAAHVFGWNETPSVGNAALLYPSADGRLRVLDEGSCSNAPWPQPGAREWEARDEPASPESCPGGKR